MTVFKTQYNNLFKERFNTIRLFGPHIGELASEVETDSSYMHQLIISKITSGFYIWLGNMFKEQNKPNYISRGISKHKRQPFQQQIQRWI